MFNRDRLLIILMSLLVFRIPLSHIIGDNGCGYFSGPFEIFWCLSLLAGAGLTVTMRGMMRDRIRREQYYNASQVYRLAKRYTVIATVLLLIICVTLYNPISNMILKDSGSRLAFLCVGPAVFLSLYVNLGIGYLSGTDNAHAAMMGEIVCGLASGIGMIIGGFLGVKYGQNIAALLRNSEVSAMYGALGSMIGICAGLFISLVFSLVMVIIYQRSFNHMIRSEDGRRNENISDISGRFTGGVLLDGAVEFLIHAPVLVSILLYRRYGIAAELTDTGDAIGAFFAKYIVITSILAILSVVPVQSSLKGIVAAASDSDNQLTSDRIVRLLGRVLYFAIPAVIFTTVLPNVIVPTLFTGRITTVIKLVSIGTGIVILYAVMYIFVSVLTRLGYGREMMIISIISLTAGGILIWFLMFKKDLGFTGAVIGMMVDYAIRIVICILILLRNFRLRMNLLMAVLLSVVISGVIGVLIKLVSTPLYNAVGGPLTLIICLIPAWFIYNVACMFFRVVSAGAMSKKFMGTLMVKIGQNLGIY